MLFLILCSLLVASTIAIAFLFLLPVYQVRRESFQVMVSTVRTKTPYGNTFVGDLFLWLIFLFFSPYSATIFPCIDTVDGSKVVISCREWFMLRNPFKSVHAAALTNLGEMTCGLHVLNQLHRKGLAIPTEINIKFIKKARGKITSTCESTVPTESVGDARTVITTQAVLTDNSKTTVALVDVSWTVNYKQK